MQGQGSCQQALLLRLPWRSDGLLIPGQQIWRCDRILSKRLNYLLTENPAEAERLMNMFQIENMMPILTETTWIVPINLTYYPLRARENVLSTLANRLPTHLRPTAGGTVDRGNHVFRRGGYRHSLRPGHPGSESLTSSRVKRTCSHCGRSIFDDGFLPAGNAP
jgi:hypothetical protein